jgi:D-sedoheptulose 7-phosphate isomerase
VKNLIQHELNSHIKVANTIHTLIDDIEIAAQICIDCLKNGGKILIFGNGGSAADAQHIAAELVGKYKIDRKGIAAIALTTDTSTLTSIANDFDFNSIFQRQIEALANKEDVAIGISTSGTSRNVLNALKLASNLECKTIGLTGNNRIEMSEICDVSIAVNSSDTPRIQEIHIVVGHTICHLIDQTFKY